MLVRRKEQLWPHVREFADRGIEHASTTLRRLQEVSEPCSLYTIHGPPHTLTRALTGACTTLALCHLHRLSVLSTVWPVVFWQVLSAEAVVTTQRDGTHLPVRRIVLALNSFPAPPEQAHHQ